MVKGKNPCVLPPCYLSPFLSHPTLSTSLMLQLVVGAVIAEVVVVMAGCQPYPFAHSTHVCPFFSLTHSPWSVHSLTTILVLFSPHAQVLGRFWSHAGFLPLPHELLSTHELQIHVLPVSGASTGKNGFVFPHAGPLLLFIPTQRNRVCLSRAFCCWV